MADLEELALKRDRGYLLRLVLVMAAGLVASMFVWQAVTGDSASACLANALLGQETEPPKGADPGKATQPKPE